MFRLRRFLALMVIPLVGAAILAAPSLAHATFSLRISDGTHTVTVADNASGDGDLTTGSITVTTSTLTAGGIVGWSAINVSTAFSNLGSGDQFAMLELATSARANTTGPLTTLTIDVSQTGFTVPASAPRFLMSSLVIATSVPGTETVQGFYDSTSSGNNLFSVPGQSSTPQQTVTSSVAPSNPANVIITPGVSPFALDYREVLTPTANGQFFSTDNELTLSTPEPGSIVLLASGAIFGLGYGRKRLLRKAAAV